MSNESEGKGLTPPATPIDEVAFDESLTPERIQRESDDDSAAILAEQMGEVFDGQRIGGLQVLVLPEWLIRRISPSMTAVLLPEDVATALREHMGRAGVELPLRLRCGRG